MQNDNTQQFRLIVAKYKALQGNAPRIVGRLAVNFFKDSFKWQGQKINGAIKPWKTRSDASPQRRKGRKLLIDHGTLRRGIIVKRASAGKVVIGMDGITNVYAKIHNDGGDIPVTLKMRKFFWAMYYEASNGLTYDIKTKDVEKSTKNKKLSADAEFWKAMALTKKTSIHIEARPFIYDSTDLVKLITTDLTKRINKIVNP